MENEYEIDGFDFVPEEPVPAAEPQAEILAQPEPEEQPAARKVSPFADSPYVMNDPIPQTSPAPKAPKKKGGKFWKRAIAAVLVLVLVVGACGVTAMVMNEYWEHAYDQLEDNLEQMQEQMAQLQEKVEDNSFTGNGNSISGTPNTSADGLTPGQVYAKNVNSVVAITCTVTTNGYGQATQGTSSGSGFIVSEDGYILTNCHVVEGATRVTVTCHDGKTYAAQITGSDASNDVALLKVEATGLPAVTLGSSADLIVGDQVVAIGNPLGELTATLTVGYIGGKDRTVTTDGTVITMLQTDAAINPGNSGGPLLNMKGEVIGITTAKYSGTTTSGASLEGLGFAIPIDDVQKIAEELLEKGYVSSAYLGVYVMDSYDGIGVLVDSTEPGGSADRAGVQGGDYIIGLGEYDIRSVADLTKALRNFEPGDTTTIVVFRGRQVLELRITLDEKPVS